MKIARVAVLLCVAVIAGSCARQAESESVGDALPDLVALERSALDKWILLNPDGYLALYAHEVTYFDPAADRRVDGQEAMRSRLAPMRGAKPRAGNPRYEMVSPKVQRYGDIAVLTFNLINYGALPDQPESILARWNATEVYRRIDGLWKIVHSHWSFTKPTLK